MKKFILLILFVFNIKCNAQNSSGTIIYSSLPIENDSGLDKLYLNLNSNFIARIKDFNFTLSFNSNNSFFELDQKFKNNNSEEIELGMLKISYFGPIFQNKDSTYTDINADLIGERIIVKKEIEKKWVLSTDTKMIDEFLCYKATTEIILVSPKKIFYHPITAWYCPKVNIPFGPFGYGNLPGLILELQTKDAIFGVKKLNLNSEPIKIPVVDKKIKVVTEAELNTIIENFKE